MKLEEIMEKEDTNKEPDGTYAAVRFDEDTVNNIKVFIEENEIPNPIKTDKLHTTLLYSRKHCPDYEPHGPYKHTMTGTPTEFDVWESQPDDDGKRSNCLVLKYDCDALVDRHNHLMQEHGATFDFDEYQPHVTLSYDIGDLDFDKLDPSKIGAINIVEEYGEDLNLNWAKDNSDMTDE